VFKLELEPYAKVIVDIVPPEEEAKAREAMDACPEQAISIEE
jgi:ferredoxin